MIDLEAAAVHESIEGHTYERYDGELSQLHYFVLEMGGLVLCQVREALRAFTGRDPALARKVINRDSDVDRLEVEVDTEIVELVARRCPIASDFRRVMAVSKCVSDLERIGDEAVKIAGLAIQVFDNDGSDPNSLLMQNKCLESHEEIRS